MFQSLVLEKHKIHYELRRKKTQRITFKMLPNLKLMITAPLYTKDFEILQMIDSHEQWILEKRKQYILLYPELMIQRQYKNGELYRFMGDEYTLQIFISSKERVVIDDRILYMFVKQDVFENKHKLVKKWLIEQSNEILASLYVSAYGTFKDNSINLPKLIIRDCKSIWGSCNYKKRSITLNRKLVHLPIELINYVIYHELVHLHHPNHSKDYYKELNHYIGNYKVFKEKLKKYSIYYF